MADPPAWQPLTAARACFFDARRPPPGPNPLTSSSTALPASPAAWWSNTCSSATPLAAACAGPWAGAMPTNSPPCATKWGHRPTLRWSGPTPATPPAWMRQMIDAHEAAAKASGARIVFSCGFDSIPFDLGVFLLQKEFAQRFGHPAPRVRGRVRKMKGTFSGGTAASLKATMAAAATNPAVLDLLKNPFSLTPGFEGPRQPTGHKPMVDEALGDGIWVAPFVMAAINTRNVHRSNFLLQHAYGTDFVYDEMLITGPGEKGET